MQLNAAFTCVAIATCIASLPATLAVGSAPVIQLLVRCDGLPCKQAQPLACGFAALELAALLRVLLLVGRERADAVEACMGGKRMNTISARVVRS